MCFKCGVCDAVVKSGPRRVHQVLREVRGRSEIEREVPVCEGCQKQLLALKMEGVPSGDALRVLVDRVARKAAARPKYQVLDAFPDRRGVGAL